MRLHPRSGLVHLSIEGLTGAEKFTSSLFAWLVGWQWLICVACRLVLVVGGNL